jgi:hypothetical protein
LGQYGTRYNNAKRVTQKAEEKYGKPADSVGHSYGGWLAQKSGNHGEINTYNKAVGLGDIGSKLSNREKDIHAVGDVVSALSATQSGAKKETIVPQPILFPNALDAHSTDHLFNQGEA